MISNQLLICLSYLYNYADDTTLYCNFDNSCNEEVINAELNNVCSCLCSNRLYLNKGKTKYVSFHTAKKQ